MAKVDQKKWFKENLIFLIKEVTRQVEQTEEVLSSGDRALVNKINDRDSLIDNYRGMIENYCFTEILNLTPDSMDEEERRYVDFIRGINVVTANLEKISDYAVSVVNQTQYFSDPAFLTTTFQHREFFEEIFEALLMIKDGLFKEELPIALDICRHEVRIDNHYAERFRDVLTRLDGKNAPSGDLVTSLFIFHYLERMGDAILNIGEAVILVVLGIRLKAYQFQALEETLSQSGVKDVSKELVITPIWGTRSGCRIARVELADGGQRAIFKEGSLKKLARETHNIKVWEDLLPGLVPQVFQFENLSKNHQEQAHKDNHGILLLENIDGRTFKDIVLRGKESEFLSALEHVFNCVHKVWSATRDSDIEAKTSFIPQLQGRINEVFHFHPELVNEPLGQSRDSAADLEATLARLKKIEDRIEGGVSVWGHGDFNIDNIIFNPQSSTVHYIDLHRSSMMDFVQDVSVFIVSSFRIPIFDETVRERLNRVSIEALKAGAEFAAKCADNTFHARLALGLIRSFITSTRFEYTRGFSSEMFNRANYLIESLEKFEDGWEDFTFPEQIVCYKGEQNENWSHRP